MSEITCCPLDGGDGEEAKFYRRTERRAAKEHRCFECREPIPKGAKYEHVAGKWDHSVLTFRTCLSCVEIRDHFACESGYVYGELWTQLEENFFPEMKAGGPCMKGLSPEAKARLFDRRMAWWERSRS
jgi:hypothetical protein